MAIVLFKGLSFRWSS